MSASMMTQCQIMKQLVHVICLVLLTMIALVIPVMVNAIVIVPMVILELIVMNAFHLSFGIQIPELV